MKSPENEPRYVISIAAKIIGIETHTLRYYEKIGLVQPYRSRGNVRYYSENDIEQLRHIKTLMCDLGINPAGVEVVIRMVKKMREMQQQIEELEAEVDRLKEVEREEIKGSAREVQE
jgi:MerR family transcriptional regulator/heat shock protein HspR